MVCDMQINGKGEVKRYQFYPAVMLSKARLTYTQVWDWIQHGTDNPLLPNIQTLYSCSRCCWRRAPSVVPSSLTRLRPR
jgi:ribonuclease R